MNKSNPFRHLAVAGILYLLAASCSDVTDDSATLPPGTCPMTFTASVDGLTATRATTDADGKTTWQAEDPIAISMDGCTNYKEYKISNTTDGAMIPDGDGNILYWSKRQETLAAWYPVSCIIGNNTGNSEVDITDQHSGFGTLENILHAPAKDYTYSSSNPVAFVFRHALAKVKVTLKKGDGIEDSDLSNATVTFTGYTAGALGYGGMTGSDGSNGDITPKTETPANGSATTYTALVIPQQMQNKQFIKVTIGSGGSARDYFYTPVGDTDANLEAGKQYTYTITVKKTGLEVALTSVPAWGENGTTTGGSEVSSFKVKIPAVSGVTPTITGAVPSAGEIYTTASSSFSITLSVSSGSRKSFNVKGGKCDVAVEHTDNGSNNKFTYSNIRSDLELVYGDYAEVGDYYYADGTWSPNYTSTGSSACIGIVFKVGAAQGDVASNYDDKLPDGIHGYVVALTDALTYAGEWGARGTDENNEFLPNASSNTDTKYNGYAQTKYILDTHSTDLTRYEAFRAMKDYATTAPANSSGWYLPSMKQLSDVWQLYKGATGNMLYDRLIGISSSNLFQTGNDGSQHNKDNSYRYWTSTERSSTDAWYIVFDTGGTIAAYAKDKGYDRLCRARAILTF